MEQWEKWCPVIGIPKRIYKESLFDNESGLIITFKAEDNQKKLIVNFDGIVVSYRNTDEGALIKTLDYLDKNYGQLFYSEWSLFKVQNSTYIQWLKEESLGIYESQEIYHYVFYTPDEAIEVLATYTPIVNIIDRTYA
jgi:hypothetical protein